MQYLWSLQSGQFSQVLSRSERVNDDYDDDDDDDAVLYVDIVPEA